MSATPKTVYVNFQHPDPERQLQERVLSAGWQLKELSSIQEREVYYDTFEWQAYEKGVVIVKKKRTLFLLSLESGNEIDSVPFQSNPASFFSDNLPVSKAKKQLSSYSNIRAFIKLCSIDALIRTYSLMNDEGKTISTLTTKSISLCDGNKQGPLANLLFLQPLKGYEKELTVLEESFTGFEKMESDLYFREIFLLTMSHAGLNVHGYSSKILLQLQGDASVYESLIQLLQFTLSVMRLNETGIIKDLDSEFLHDYRVAVRRTRSILKQLKGVFDPEETDHYLKVFRELGKRTNELRDLDVCLLRQATWFSSLPPSLQPALETFFSEIKRSRTTIHKQLSRFFLSDAYLTLIDEWCRFITRKEPPDHNRAPNALLSTKTIAITTIKKAWKKVIQHGRLIGKEASDAELHALRIDCKKLRYLLEFFSSVFPQKISSAVIRQLKELQENLGDFVDLAVQTEFLLEHLLSGENDSKDRMFAASTGGVMAILYQKQEEARQQFHHTFSMFDNDDTTRLFHELLNHPH
jgi:CHAD domain-containing protein